jgi:Mce-associated membrane protein
MNHGSAKDDSTTDGSTTKRSTSDRSVTDGSTRDGSTRDSGKTAWTSRLMDRITPAVALSVAALVLLTAAAIGVTKSRQSFVEAERSSQGAAALAAGRQLAVNFVTMDYRSFDTYSAQVLSGASGSFRADYAAKLADLKKVMLANHAVSSVKQVEAGLVSSDRDSAQVIVGVVAPTSNTATPQAVDKSYRLRLDLQRTPDRNATWKVINLVFVS